MLETLQPQRFHVIVADCGTRFDAFSAKGETARSPQKKYQTMTDAELTALPVADVAARNAFLFYWDTTARIAVGRHIPIMRAWGFEPTAFAFTWVKLLKREDPSAPWFYPRGGVHCGTGFTTRKNTEVCILGRRGSPRRRDASVFEVIFSPRREHSRKPREFYERVERYASGPYLELFARERRDGWTAWGDEIDKFTDRSRLPTRIAAE